MDRSGTILLKELERLAAFIEGIADNDHCPPTLAERIHERLMRSTVLVQQVKGGSPDDGAFK